MNVNPINTALSAADQESVTAAIAAIKQKLPFLIDLSKDDRQALPKLGDKSQAFLRKALDVAVLNPGVLPVSFDLNQMRNNGQLFSSLSSISLALGQLHKQVDDTAIQVGSQAYAAARTVYDCAKSSFAGPALQTAAGELGKRFGRKNPSQTLPPAENTPAPTPPAPTTAST